MTSAARSCARTLARLCIVVLAACILVTAVSIGAFGGAQGVAFANEAVACNGDSDCDGLPDSNEDFDGDGIVDVYAGETDPANPDSDGDGLTDGEERLHIGRIEAILSEGQLSFQALDRLDPNNPDSDRDCLPDGLELGASETAVRELLARMPNRPLFELSPRCITILGEHNGTELQNVVPADESLPADVGNIAMFFDLDPSSLTDPTAGDTDGDGVEDGIEDYNFNGQRDRMAQEYEEQGQEALWLEMDPLLPDSDGDGMIDGEEGDWDGDGEIGPDESDPLTSDTDGDGVEDGDEVRAGTKINVCDTDDDGLSDGVEMGRIQPYDRNGCHGLQPSGTNYRKPTSMDPLNPDSDGDGLIDGEEDQNGNGWIDPADTDPSAVDTDDDGLPDGVEALGDFDGDGVPDFDIRLVEGGRDCQPPEDVADIDCDGVPNARDDDSDEDGCPDSIEGGWIDVNANGIPDVYDNKTKVCPEPSVGGGWGGGGGEPAEEEGPPDLASRFSLGAADGGACALVRGPKGVYPSILIIVCALLFLVFPPLCFIPIRRRWKYRPPRFPSRL